MNRYLTTPIYYASGAPHLGHAYTTLVADCYKRFYLLSGENVILTTGTDEHGQKIWRSAQGRGVPVEGFVSEHSQKFQQLWRALKIDVDRFERTTSENHLRFVQAFWQRLVENGDIYLDKYEGLYCVDCEQYFTEGEICPIHRKPLDEYSESTYFFRLSRYRNQLIQHIETHNGFILPIERRNEVLAFLKGNELKDLSISRTTSKWGIPVPNDPSHTIYVWIDALVTYISALSQDRFVGLENAAIQDWWQNTTHFIGKDILNFHAIYWPALLLSAKLPLPRRLVVNGWLTVEGRKIAKSDLATVVDPEEVITKIGRDGLRLFFLKNVSLGQDVNFSLVQAIQFTNSHLANNIGNLFSRFIGLAQRNFGGQWTLAGPVTREDNTLLKTLSASAKQYNDYFLNSDLAQAARIFIESATQVNVYLQIQKPWALKDKGRLSTVLWTVHHALSDISILGFPFVPETSIKARDALCLEEVPRNNQLGVKRDIVKVKKVTYLYRRIN